MQQIEFYPALFALILLHHFPWSEEINVLGMIFLSRNIILSYQEINVLGMILSYEKKIEIKKIA